MVVAHLAGRYSPHWTSDPSDVANCERRNRMRTIHVISIFVLILTAVIFTYSQSPQSSGRPMQSETRIQENQPVKASKLLVKNLPKGLQGIVIEKGVFRLKQGYKFVNLPNNTVGVALKANGEIGGTFTCGCYKEAGAGGSVSGTCRVAFDKENRMMCRNDPQNSCSAVCFLEAKVNSLSSRLAIF